MSNKYWSEYFLKVLFLGLPFCKILGFIALLAAVLTISLVTHYQFVHELVLFTTLGKDGCAKSDYFLEKFQTAFDPPPIFGKLYCKFCYIVAYMRGDMMAG